VYAAASLKHPRNTRTIFRNDQDAPWVASYSLFTPWLKSVFCIGQVFYNIQQSHNSLQRGQLYRLHLLSQWGGDPHNIRALVDAGLAFDDLGNHSEVIKYYEKVLLNSIYAHVHVR
jgi:hypothetical protein